MIIFNLVGMGFDAYQAYDSLSKLDRVSDPKQRQDLIVNATFSIASCVLNGITVIGVIIGSSTIPVVVLLLGAYYWFLVWYIKVPAQLKISKR
ncbi:hypothetical protein G9396_20535 [Providencia rettgeri]|nr:hypothetical protein G9396_20535 [Providencia rettgeri]